MKKRFLSFLFLCALCTVSCVDYGPQIEQLQKEIDDLSANLDRLDNLTKSLGALRDVLVIGQAGDPIVSAAQKDNGYDFQFTNSGLVHIDNKTAGISVGNEDGTFFWTLNGEPLKDASGNKAAISISPEFRVEEGTIEISTDGKKSWKPVGDDTTPVISKVQDNADSITVTFMGATEVVFTKNVTWLHVSLSGDGSKMASEGTATVDFLLNGTTDSYTVTPLLSDGWSADVVWENSFKGKVVFKAPAAGPAQTARLFFCDGIGNMVASDIDFDAIKVDENFPVMFPVWEAYNIGEEGGNLEVSLINNQDEYIISLEEDADWIALGGTKAVREDVIVLLVEPNENSQMRSTIVTFTAGTYVKTVAIWQDAAPILSGQNLSENGTANCYIVNHEGDYCFDATVMGNGPEGLIAGADLYTETTELFPASVEVYSNLNDVVSKVRLQDGKVYFHASGAKGNAFISVKDSRSRPRVIWSWHIWCTDTPKERTHTNPDQLQFTVLDRNLGATSADPADGEATYGMYYQWGRKDPYTKDKVKNEMTANTSKRFLVSIQYPDRPYSQEGQAEGNWYEELNNYLWGNPDYGRNRYLKDLVKTIYDPCPVGYMVPPANTFLIFEDEKRSEFTAEGILVHGDFGQINFFPWAGRTYRGFDTSESELALWHSSAARWSSNESGGGAQTIVDKGTGAITWYQGDMRARALPIRCVKQVAE